MARSKQDGRGDWDDGEEVTSAWGGGDAARGDGTARAECGGAAGGEGDGQ